MGKTSTKDRKEYLKRYREQNKEKIAERNRKYYQENKEQIAEQQREYYQENKEQIAEYQKEYYQENKEKLRNKYNICDMDCFNCIYDDCIIP